MHRLAQPSQDGLMVPSWNVSSDKSINTVPSWNVSFVDRSLCTQVLLGLVNKSKYHSPWCPMVFWGWVLLPSVITCIKTQSVRSGGQLVTEKPTIHWQYLSKSMWLCGQHLSWDIVWPTIGYRCVKLLYGQCKCGIVSGSDYLLWAQYWVPNCFHGFSPLSCKERLKHWAHRDTGHWDSTWIIRW